MIDLVQWHRTQAAQCERIATRVSGEGEAAEIYRKTADELERAKMLDKIMEKWALAFMQIRTMQGNPIEIARKAMDTSDDEQELNRVGPTDKA